MALRPRIDPFQLLNAAASPSAEPRSDRLEARARLRFTVAKALSQDRLIFRYQPVACASNPKFAAFHEMIALLRLPEGRVVPASAFASAIEDNEIGRTIDRLALRRALRMLEETPGLRLAVNVSPRSMGDVEWLDLLSEPHARGTSVSGRLILEIGEDAAVKDADLVRDLAAHVRDLGPAFALDNFGAGATGFAHFRAFRFDMVKIDPTFCRGVHDNPDSQVLVECLQKLALQFEMLSVADGVDSEADAAWLCDAGLDCLQGPFHGLPTARPESPQCDLADRGAGRNAG